MGKYRIAWMPGDGVGVDVLEAAKIVLDAIALDAEYVPAEIGWTCWEKYGNALPDETIEILKSCKCGFFGAITSKPHVPGYRSPIVRMRQLFDLYVNQRPCKAYPGNPLNHKEGIDLVIFRENTEGLYFGAEFFPVPPALAELEGVKGRIVPEETAISLRVITRKGSRRIIKAAFEYARKYHRKSVTVAHKANVVRKTCGLFLEEAEKIAGDYPDIKYGEANIDAMTMWLIKNPTDYDVIVTTNLFGDIISDEAAQLVGGLGFASAGNIGETLAVFEPTHGSAPKYAGLYKVNPMATLLAARLMLEWLGESRKAGKLEDAIATVIREGKARTYDMGGTSTTLEVAEEVARKL
ncbi:MAG: isocitrate/isopropylmalate dehydrogenase family protein [Candidatus Eisenbacteria bacterium]